MKKVLDVLDRLFHYLAAIGFGCVTVCVLVQILARYIPGVTAPWTDEMTRLFFQYTIMIACPMAIKYHEYASIDVIAAQTHGTGRHILNLVSDAAILIVCLFGIPQARTISVLAQSRFPPLCRSTWASSMWCRWSFLS